MKRRDMMELMSLAMLPMMPGAGMASSGGKRNVEETRQYIRDFIRLNDATKTARELYDKMLELYPEK
jgi:hypothetical protein